MPSGYLNPNARVTSGFLDTVNDSFPGGGSTSPGQAPGQRGSKVGLGAGFPTDNVGVRFSSAFKTPLTTIPRGIFQYVESLSTDSLQPAQGLIAFWSDRANYIVTTSDTNLKSRAGVYLGAPTKGNLCFIQCFDEGGIGYVKAGAAVTATAQDKVYPAADGTATFASAATPSDANSEAQFGIALSAKDAATALTLVQFSGAA
jgi:hypothetical protein